MDILTQRITDVLFDLSISGPEVKDAIKLVMVIALGIGGINFFINLAFNYGKHALESLANVDETKFPDWMQIGRTVLLTFAIILYMPLALIISGTVSVVNNLTAENEASMGQLQSMVEKFNEATYMDSQELTKSALKLADENTATQLEQDFAKRELANQEEDVDKGILQTLKEIAGYLNPQKATLMIMNSVVLLVTGLIRLIIVGIASAVFKILIIVGPLAIAFSILPGFEKQLTTWLGTVLNVGFTITTMNILDKLLIKMFSVIHQADFTDLIVGQSTYMSVLVYNVVISVLYLMCFWLTSKYIGKGDGGRVISKMVGIGAAAAALAASGGAASGAVAAGGSSSAGTAGGIGAAGNLSDNAIE